MNDSFSQWFWVVSATDYGLIEIGFGGASYRPSSRNPRHSLGFHGKAIEGGFQFDAPQKNLLPPAEAILGCPQPAIFIDEAINAKMRDQELAWIIKEFAMVHLMTIMSLH